MQEKLLLACALALSSSVPSAAPAAAPDPAAARAAAEEDLRARFEALDDAHDEAGMTALWREHPAQTLGTLDSYLEGSLGLVEKDPATDPARIAALEERALRGAKAADLAFGTAVFADYAAAFGGWSAEDQQRFRKGQALFGEASKALRAKQHETALSKARESLALARPLGDWWGTAMALGAEASALLELGRPGEALESALQARLLNHDLRLVDAELASLETLVRAAEALGARARAVTAAEAGLALAKGRKAEPRIQAFEQALARLRPAGK